MKTKRKIMAILMVFILTIIPLSVAEAGNNSRTQNDNNSFLEIGTLGSNGIPIFEKIFLSENELFELEGILSDLIDKIQSNQDHKSLEDIIDGILGQNNPILYRINKATREFKLSNSKAFVISSGHGYDLSPLKRNSFKITKKISFWHYASDGLLKDRTIILRPLALDANILKGGQFGIMTGFTGIYLRISQGFAKNSYTFFMGTARHIKGMDLSLPPIFNTNPNVET